MYFFECLDILKFKRRTLKHKYTFFIFVLIGVIAFVHFILIPSFTDSYNKDCYLNKKSMKALQYTLLNIINIFEKHNVTYWLDFGTLLGAYRYKGIIPWDGDGDVSYFFDDPTVPAAIHELKSVGVDANTMVADYDGMRVDFMRWKRAEGRFHGKKTKMLYKYYPSWVSDNIITKVNHYVEAFPEEWIGKRTKIPFLSTTAFVPEQYLRRLKTVYKFSFWISMPYKWKCYVPCFVYSSDASCST